MKLKHNYITSPFLPRPQLLPGTLPPTPATPQDLIASSTSIPIVTYAETVNITNFKAASSLLGLHLDTAVCLIAHRILLSW